jgi:hypothetical protein
LIKQSGFIQSRPRVDLADDFPPCLPTLLPKLWQRLPPRTLSLGSSTADMVYTNYENA